MTSKKDRELDQIAIDSLEASTQWLITEATPRLYISPDSGMQIANELIDKYLVSSYIVPKIGEEYEIVSYIPKSRGIYYVIILLTATEHGGRRYEYWVLFRSSKDWATLQLKDCRFMVATSKDKTSQREIVQSQQAFFHNYKVAGETIFNLDYLDPDLKWALRVEDYSACFKDYPELSK